MFAAFRTPGGGLGGRDKDAFDELKTSLDRCTDEMLIRPNWDNNLTCVELVNNVNSPVILQEFIFLMRKKVGIKQPTNVIFLGLTLLESLVKNGGRRLHAAVNDAEFTNHLVKLARKFNAPGMSGSEARDVAELVLLIIQSWGEACMSSREFPNIVKAYQDCRKEGMRFPEHYDESRAPVFIGSSMPEPAPAATSRRYSSQTTNIPSNPYVDEQAEDDADAVLAAAIAASIQDNSAPVRRATTERRPTATAPSSNQAPPPSSSETLVHSLSSLISLLYELISASTSAQELGHNELASDVAAQLQAAQSQLSVAIENALMSAPEQVDNMFKWNDEATQAIQFYKNVKSQSIPLATAVEQIKAYTLSRDKNKKAKDTSDKSKDDSVSLLDMGEGSGSSDSAVAVAITTPPPVDPVPAVNDLDIFLNPPNASSEHRASFTGTAATNAASKPSKLLPPPPAAANAGGGSLLGTSFTSAGRRPSATTATPAATLDPFALPPAAPAPAVVEDPFSTSTTTTAAPAPAVVEDPFSTSTTTTAAPVKRSSIPADPFAVAPATTADPFAVTPAASTMAADPFSSNTDIDMLLQPSSHSATTSVNPLDALMEIASRTETPAAAPAQAPVTPAVFQYTVQQVPQLQGGAPSAQSQQAAVASAPVYNIKPPTADNPQSSNSNTTKPSVPNAYPEGNPFDLF